MVYPYRLFFNLWAICNQLTRIFSGFKHVCVITETYMLTTVWDKVSEKERNSLDNYQEVVIIGSCSLVLVLVIGIMAKLYINKYKRQHDNNQPNCVLSPTSCDSFKITSFKSLTLNESYDPDLYENTRNWIISGCSL